MRHCARVGRPLGIVLLALSAVAGRCEKTNTGTGSNPLPGSLNVEVVLTAPVFAPQQASAWCWAATISNLFAFYGHPVAQQRIVAEVYGVPANIRGGDYSNMARLLNRNWIDDNGRPFSATLIGVFDEVNGVYGLTNDGIRDSLRANRPLVIGTTDHAMLILSMTYRETAGHVSEVVSVQVFDPWPGIGFRPLRPAEMQRLALGGSLMFVADARISP